jgi:PD-(D/E)XK nuclease superfamily
MPNQIERIIQSLKESPVFNMSLGSKELFHSNFIAWLLDPVNQSSVGAQGVGKMLRFLFHDLKSNDALVRRVEREVKHFDLKVTLESRALVIENKFKGNPSIEQLEKYSVIIAKEKLNTECVLLSLIEPAFFDANSLYVSNNGTQWRFLSYDKLLSVFRTIRPDNEYVKGIVRDYQIFLESVLKLRRECMKLWKNEKELVKYPGDTYIMLQEIRMHDLYEKWRMNELKTRMKNHIREDSIIITDFTNSQGLLDIQPTDAKDEARYFKKIQIQGKQLRQVVQIFDDNHKGNGVFEKANKLLKSKKWFMDCENEKLPANTKKTPSDRYGFCSYKDKSVYKFAYRWETIGTLDRVIELAKQVGYIK